MLPKIFKHNLMIGRKAYRYLDENTLEVIRITRVKNENCFVCKKVSVISKLDNTSIQNTEERFTLTKKELDNYVLLVPDALVVFTKVKVADDDDVAVNLIRYDGIKGNGALPYAICRQNVRDFFESIVNNQTSNVGCSISQDTVPLGCDFKAMLVASSVVNKDVICAYLDDSLIDILKLVNTINYDECLKSIRDKAEKFCLTYNVELPKGYCSTVKALLEDNLFMDDFYRCFDIKFFDDRKFNIIDNTLDDENLKYISEKLGFRPLGHFITKYDKTINLNKISYNYILIKDKYELYVLLYGDSKKVLPAYAELHQDILNYYRTMEERTFDHIYNKY